MKVNVIDLFCGVGGLSFGLKKVGFNILAGYDIDSSCKYAYETNIKADFINKNNFRQLIFVDFLIICIKRYQNNQILFLGLFSYTYPLSN